MKYFETQEVVKEKFPSDIGELIMSFLAEEVSPWDSYDMWVPEYDSCGNYGMFPMGPELPLFA